MNTNAVLRDLVASALARGVSFATEVEVERLLLDRYGPIRINGMLCQSKGVLPKYIKANCFIFAVGSGFEPFLADLQVRARLKRSRSAMVVARPTLAPLNFVRMSNKNRFHFNHFIQYREVAGEQVSYSMLADSGYASGDSGESVDIEPILQSAERYFGKDELYARQLFSYECVKTEFISDDEQKRRYSYWLESDPQSNYLCVLPGKFSFFPTVAVQAYRRLKNLIDFEAVAPQSAWQPEPRFQQQAAKLVAAHYPVQVQI